MVTSQGFVSVVRLLAVPVLAVAGATGLVVACSSSSSTADTNPDFSKFSFDNSGAVAGIDDTHCVGDGGTTFQQPVGSCEAGAPAMTGSGGDGGTAGPQVNFNNKAFDDDCKYVVQWVSTKVVEKTDVYFKITVNRTVDASPATGADPSADVFLGDDTHPALPGSRKASLTEVAPGQYVVGPYQFDAPGTWTTRFQMYPTCNDAPASPHGHSAFFVLVP